MAKPMLRHLRQAMIEFDRVDSLEAIRYGGDHLAVVGSGFHQGGETELSGVFQNRTLLDHMRNTARLAAKLPIPVIRIVTELFELSVDWQLLQKRSHWIGGAVCWRHR